MIKKTRQEPLKIRKLSALFRRLPPSHPKLPLIERELARYKAGYHGEQSLDYPLSYLPEKQYLIFHDLRLSDDSDHFFQLDTILLSRFFILILEVKNISGTIYFDDTFRQLIRTFNGQEEGFADPLSQVERQRLHLQNWLSAHKFPPVPIETLVVISNPSTVIKASPRNPKLFKRIIHNMHLSSKINEIAAAHRTERISEKELKKLSRFFIKNHTPSNPNVLAEFSIELKDLLKGVHCPNCGCLPMKRERGTWVCSKCDFSQKSAHLNALQDYRLLIRPDITNQQLRDFLLLSSRSTASKILTSMNLEHSGETKGRKYWLPVGE